MATRACASGYSHPIRRAVNGFMGWGCALVPVCPTRPALEDRDEWLHGPVLSLSQHVGGGPAGRCTRPACMVTRLERFGSSPKI
jgi:hypothetical protein